MFSRCATARLCAASQDRQTDRQGFSDVFTICSGRTDKMGDAEEERHFHSVQGARWGVSEDLLPDINHYLSQASQTLLYHLWHTVILNLKQRPGVVNDALFLLIYKTHLVTGMKSQLTKTTEDFWKEPVIQ